MNKQLYYRLIALWVLCEAMLGGIIHGLKIPVSGLVVGSCAVICICLIAWYVPVKGAIIKATIIVAVFKMMLSPQSPPPAYLAVFFQGLMGEALFWNKRFFKLSCVLLGVLALVESGVQRILVLTILYSNDLWKVINDFINGLTRQKITTNYSLLIGGGYVLLHLITGLLVGWWASLLPGRIIKWSKEEGNIVIVSNDTVAALPVLSKKKIKLKKGLLIIWIVLILLYIQSYFKIGTPLLPSHISLKILLRSFIIVLSWYLIIGPLVKKVLHYWLQKKKKKSREDIQQVLQLLPATQQLIAQSWRQTSTKKRWKRLTAFSKMILVNALTPQASSFFGEGSKVFILTGPVQSGKTTSLVKWSENRKDVFGILTPVVNGKRMFMNVHLRHLFDMEAALDEKEIIRVGRFFFSKTNFDKAIQIIREADASAGWLLIDEIGPVELRGEGFSKVVKEILRAGYERQRIILVVREGLVEKVKDFFQLKEVVVINNISELG